MISHHIAKDGSQNGDASAQAIPYLEAGRCADTVIFLHGLFSKPQHWLRIMDDLADRYRVIAPQLPVDRQPGRRTAGISTIDELTRKVADLIESLELKRFVLCGNSLGGLVAIDYCLQNRGQAAGIVLAGSAGLYERGLTNGESPRPTRDFVRAVASDIFFDEKHITDELVDQWYYEVTDRDYVRFVLRISRATRHRRVKEELDELNLPALLVWGRNDKVTPPEVAEQFSSLIRGSQLKLIDECGHAPNLEQPEIFSRILREFLPRCFAECQQRDAVIERLPI